MESLVPVCTRSLQKFVLTVVAGLAGCSAMENGTSGEDGDMGDLGGSNSSGGVNTGGGSGGVAGAAPSGGTPNMGGNVSTGGAPPSGGTTGLGGASSGGGSEATGGLGGSGNAPTGGTMGVGGSETGGAATGGSPTGGAPTGGTAGGGRGGTGGGGTGGRASGGKGGTATGGSGTGGSGGASSACSMTTPLTGGTVHTSANQSGTAAGMTWTIWSNGAAGSITTYSTPAFRAQWNNSGDYLARLGLQWNATRTYDTYGVITAQYAYTKSGSGGGYSYIGIYGWSVSPCVEFYIVDDSYNRMPVNPGNTTNKGTAMIDGGTYTLYTRNTTGTGGSKCPGTSNWVQYYSVRQTARTCGQISITDHFNAWTAAGMPLGKMDQAQLLVEVGGGSGSADFTYALVSATTP